MPWSPDSLLGQQFSFPNDQLTLATPAVSFIDKTWDSGNRIFDTGVGGNGVAPDGQFHGFVGLNVRCDPTGAICPGFDPRGPGGKTAGYGALKALDPSQGNAAVPASATPSTVSPDLDRALPGLPAGPVMVKRHIRLLLIGALLISAAGTLAAGFGQPDYTVKLDFTNADGVVKGADLNISGVQAGKVEALEVKGKVAVVTVTVDSQFTPLHSGAKGLIRSLGLLGHKYVEVVDGKGRGELKSGSELSIDNTTSPTDLDQINAIFDAPTREKIKTLTNEGAIALGGRAQTLNDDLRQLRNLAVAAEPATGVLDSSQVALDRATIAFDTFTQQLVNEDASVRGFVSHGSSVLSSASVHDQELAGLLAHGDSTFGRLNSALNGNQNSLAGFFARGPSGLASGNYQLNASIPTIKVTQSVLPALFELVYNTADASSGLIGTGDPNNPNSGTMGTLRVIAQPCEVVTGRPTC